MSTDSIDDKSLILGEESLLSIVKEDFYIENYISDLKKMVEMDRSLRSLEFDFQNIYQKITTVEEKVKNEI